MITRPETPEGDRFDRRGGEERAPSALRLVSIAVALLCVFSIHAYLRFRGLSDAGSMDCAQLARNLVSGHGYVTRVVRPTDAAFLRDAGAVTAEKGMPELRRPPLYPAVLSAGLRVLRPSMAAPGAFRRFQPETRVIIPFGIAWSLLAACVINLLARRMFSDRVGLLAAVLYAGATTALADSLSGSPRAMMTALAAAAIYAAVVSVQNRLEHGAIRTWWCAFVSAALLCGFGALTGYGAWLLVPALAWYVSRPLARGRTAAALGFVLLVVLVTAPWFLRNLRLCGNPLGTACLSLLHDTGLYPGDSVDRMVDPSFHNVLVARALRAKFVSNLGRLSDLGISDLGGGVLVCLFLAGFFLPSERDEGGWLRWAAAGAIVAAIAAAALTSGNLRDVGILLPLVAVFGAGAADALVAQLRVSEEWKPVMMIGVMTVSVLPVALRVTGGAAAGPYPPCYPPFVAYTSAFMGEEEAIASDIPSATAWYGNRTAVLLPESTAAFEALHGRWPFLRAVYLTQATGDRPMVSELLDGGWQSWKAVIERRIPETFPLQHAIALPPDGHAQLFITDRPRWPVTRRRELMEDRVPNLRVRMTPSMDE